MCMYKVDLARFLLVSQISFHSTPDRPIYNVQFLVFVMKNNLLFRIKLFGNKKYNQGLLNISHKPQPKNL